MPMGFPSFEQISGVIPPSTYAQPAPPPPQPDLNYSSGKKKKRKRFLGIF